MIMIATNCLAAGKCVGIREQLGGVHGKQRLELSTGTYLGRFDKAWQGWALLQFEIRHHLE